MMRWRRLVPVLMLGALSVIGEGACSAPPSKGALVLAISTNMRTPKDLNVVSVFITTNSVVKFDYLGRVLPDGTVALPATLAVLEPDDPKAQVRIRVIAFQEQNARVLRDVLTTVPHQTTALLRLPLNFLDDNSGSGMLSQELVPRRNGAPDGTTAFDPDTIASACDFSQGLTSINGICVDATVDSQTLAAYDPSEVYGDGGLMSSGAPSSCFDVGRCFARAVPVGAVDMQACTASVPSGIDPATMNLALVTPSTGVCLAQGCFVPLESDQTNGWTVSGGTIQMIAGICKKIAQGAQLYASSGTCAPKALDEPVCEPTTFAEVDGGTPPLADGGKPASCDGGYVVTCLGNATCGGNGGYAALGVVGNQATLYIPQGDGEGGTGPIMPLAGTVDPTTCIATFMSPPGDGGRGCDGGILSLTIDLRSGATSGLPCTNTSSDGGCTQSTMSCTVAPATLDGGPSVPDASTTVDASTSTDAGGASSVSGNVNGISLSPKDQISAAGFITGTYGQEAVIGIVMTDTVGACTVNQQSIAGGDQKAGSTQLALALASGSTALAPGSYSINSAGDGGVGTLMPGQMWVYAALTQMSSSCMLQPSTTTGTQPDSQAVTGTITIAQITGAAISGTFNLNFNSGSLTGTFTAPICSGLDLQKLFTTSAPNPGPDSNGICYYLLAGDGGPVDASQPPPRPDGYGPDVGVGQPDSSTSLPDTGAPPDTGSPTDSGQPPPTDSSIPPGDAGDATVADTGVPPDASQCYLLPASAVAWYRAEGDSTDALGGAQATWGGTAAYGAGQVGQGFSFSGGSFLTVSVVSAGSTGTVEGWVQTSPSMFNFDVFGFGSGALTEGIVALSIGSTTAWQPELLFNTQTVLGPNVNSAAWNHVAFTWNLNAVTAPPSMVLYVNGQATTGVPSMLDAGIPQMFLMGGDSAGSANMTGLLDEVTIYTSVLSASQITGIYAAGTTGKCQCRTNTDCPAAKPTCNASGLCQ